MNKMAVQTDPDNKMHGKPVSSQNRSLMTYCDGSHCLNAVSPIVGGLCVFRFAFALSLELCSL